MTQITDIYKFTEYWKNRYPQVYQGKSDREIVDLVRERYPDIGIPSYEEALVTDESSYVPEQPKDYPKGSLNNEKIDPAWVDSWFLTSDFVPEKWKEEGALGGLISADFFRSSYNQSMAGMLYRTSHGKDKWDVSEDYNPEWYAQAGQFAVGMIAPLDVLTMLTTGGLGKLVNFAYKNKTLGNVAQRTVEGALNLGVGGGTFAATHAMLDNTSKQRLDNPDKPVNISEALKAASDEFLHAAPMFAISGGVTQGIMGSIYGYSQAFASKSPTYSQKLTQAATSPLARVGTEATLFTSLPSVLGDQDAPKFGSNEWWAGLGTNTLVVGAMRGIGSLVEPKLVTSKGKKVSIEAFEVLNGEINLAKRQAQAELKPLENVKKSLQDSGTPIPKNINDKIAELRGIISENPKLKAQFKKDYKYIQEINTKIDTVPKYLEKGAIKGSAENKELIKYNKLVNDHSTFSNGIHDNILTTEGRASELWKEITGKEGTPAEIKAFEISLKNTVDNINKNQKSVEDYLTGNWQQSKDGITGGGSTLKPPKPPKPTRESEISKYVNLLAGEKKVLPKEIVAEPSYQRGIIIPGENKLSLRKLKEAYQSELKKRPGNPEAELTKTLIALDVSKTSELPVFSKKIAGKKPIKDYISELKLDKTNEKMLYQGISEFMQTRKSSNNPSNYKIIADYAKWLESKGKNLSEANRSLTDLYVTEQNAVKKFITKNQRSQLNNSLSAFYGTGGVGKQPLDTGFAYKYMGTKEKTPAVSQLGVDRGGTVARPESIALVEPKDYGLVRAKNKELIKEGRALQGKGKQTVEPLTYDVATELLYNFGARGEDSLNRLFIENIDIKNGTIKEWSTGVGQKGAAGPRLDVPIKKMLSELWKNIVKVIGDRKSGNLLKGIDGKNLLGDSVNIINKAIMPKGVNLRGKKGKLTVSDYRKMAMTDAFNIGGDKLREFVKLNLIGHKTELTQRYTKLEYEANWKKFIDGRKALDKTKTIPVKEKVVADISGSKREQIKFWEQSVASIKRDLKNAKSAGERENLRSQLKGASMKLSGVKKIKEKRAKRLPEEEVFQSKGDKTARDRFITKVMKKNNLTNEQLKQTKLSPKVLGEFGEGIIKLQKGVFQPADFYHENLHRLKEFGRITKNKTLNKLIERGEKLAVKTKEYKEWKKKNINRDVEEFLADIAGGKASRMEFSKGVLPKINQFVKQLVSKVKVALGAGNFKDISNVLAKRLQKGFSTEGVEFTRGQVKFKMEGMSEEQAIKFGKSVFNELFKKEELRDRGLKNQIEKYIGDIAQLGEDFKLSRANPIEVEQFVSTLRSMDVNIIKRLPDKLGWLKAFKNVESQRLTRNITEAKRNTLLKDLGVADGNMYLASAKQLRDFSEVINTLDIVKKSSTSWIDQRIAAGMIDKKLADKFLSLRGGTSVLPVTYVLEYVGLNKLAQKIYNHTSSKLEYEGNVSTYENNMKNIYGRKKWDTVKDFTYLFDKERYFDRLENNYLTNKEKKFINQTFNINVDKKTMIAKKGKPGEIVRAHEKLKKEYRDEFNIILKKILNDAEFEKFTKDKPIEWIKNNVYVQRRVTKEAKLALDVTGHQYNKIIKNQTDSVAKKAARNYFERELKKNYTKEQFDKKVQSLIDDGTALSIARANIGEAVGGFNSNKYSPNFYKNRHEKLPEKIMYEGKMIETYERTYAATTKDYSIGQGQFLATLEFFPEYIRMKGFNIPNTNDLLPRLKRSVRTQRVGKYVDKAVKDHLGIGKPDPMFPDAMSFLRTSTSLAAKLQLSSPTSGLKNALVGGTQNFLAFRTKDYLLSIADTISKDNRARVIGTGATEIGMRSIEVQGVAGRLDKVASQFFRWGGMKVTENFNRFTSVLAGKRDQLGLSRVLQTAGENTRVYKNTINKLREFYKLSDKEIMLLKKFGMDGMQGLDTKTIALNKRNLNKLYQKMDTFAHINTQGAAINAFMPDWARSEVAQSALLYKRMAYAATVNTTRNLKIAWQNKSLFQPIAFGLGTYYSGEAMIAVYDKFFGQAMPKENSSKFWQFITTLWKGEFMGILSEALNPYENKHPLDSMYPSLLSTGNLMWDSTMQMLKGQKFVSQGFKDIGKNLAGIYNATAKVYNRGLLAKDSYASQSKRYGSLYKDYIEEINNRDEVLRLNQSNIEFKTSKYMRSFREIFESGYEKDARGNTLGKWYMMSLFAKANNYYYTGFDENGTPIETPQEALKRAAKSMKTSLTNLNPNKATVTAKDKKGKTRQTKEGLNFINWLDRNEKLSPGLEKLNNQYAFRYNLTIKSAEEYIKTSNLEKDLEYYNIPIRKLLK